MRRDGEQVFGDVHDQFSSVPAILRRFDEWRDTELDSYREAYIELFLPRLLTGVVRARFLQVWPFGSAISKLKKSRVCTLTQCFQNRLHSDETKTW